MNNFSIKSRITINTGLEQSAISMITNHALMINSKSENIKNYASHKLEV